MKRSFRSNAYIQNWKDKLRRILIIDIKQNKQTNIKRLK